MDSIYSSWFSQHLLDSQDNLHPPYDNFHLHYFDDLRRGQDDLNHINYCPDYVFHLYNLFDLNAL